jgi:hypothetical protein
LVLAIIRSPFSAARACSLYSPANRNGRIDVALLPLLGSACQQDHQYRTVLTEINPVAWSEVDPEFEHALANRFDAGEVAAPA